MDCINKYSAKKRATIDIPRMTIDPEYADYPNLFWAMRNFKDAPESPLTPRDIMDHEAALGYSLKPFERDIILQMDNAFRHARSEVHKKAHEQRMKNNGR